MEQRRDPPAQPQQDQGGVATAPRFVTRRARACGCQIDGTSDKAPIEEVERVMPASMRGIFKVTIYATIVDIGDPRWRLWLTQDITSRCNHNSIEIHIVG